VVPAIAIGVNVYQAHPHIVQKYLAAVAALPNALLSWSLIVFSSNPFDTLNLYCVKDLELVVSAIGSILRFYRPDCDLELF